MEKFRLISMTDFCLQLLNENAPYNEVKMLTQISNYATFLKQPLKLEMFVPCDEDGNVLEEPTNYEVWEEIYLKDKSSIIGFKEHESYFEAKDKVLFESFMVLKNEPLKYVTIGFNNIILTWSYKDNDFLLNNGRTIERFIKSDLTLTQNAIKQLGL